MNDHRIGFSVVTVANGLRVLSAARRLFLGGRRSLVSDAVKSRTSDRYSPPTNIHHNFVGNHKRVRLSYFAIFNYDNNLKPSFPQRRAVAVGSSIALHIGAAIASTSTKPLLTMIAAQKRGKVVSRRNSYFRGRTRDSPSASTDRRPRSAKRTVRILLQEAPSPSVADSSKATRRRRCVAGGDDRRFYTPASLSGPG
jgi:hypothetical protein